MIDDRSGTALQLVIIVFQDAGFLPEEPTPELLKAAAQARLGLMDVLNNDKTLDEALERIGHRPHIHPRVIRGGKDNP